MKGRCPTWANSDQGRLQSRIIGRRTQPTRIDSCANLYISCGTCWDDPWWARVLKLVIYRTCKPSMGETEEREAAALLGSLSPPPLSLSLETRCRRTRPPFGKNEETQQHSWSRHHHHLQEIRTRPKSGPKWKWVAKSLGNGIATHLAAGPAGHRDSFLGKSVQTRTSNALVLDVKLLPDRDPQRRVSQLQMNSQG